MKHVSQLAIISGMGSYKRIYLRMIALKELNYRLKETLIIYNS